MHDTQLLNDLALIMAAAAVTSILCHWLQQPVVLGYILAGFLVGPQGLIGWLTPSDNLNVHDTGSIETLGELGVIFLLFSLGLEFSLRKLRRVGSKAIVAGGLEIPLMALMGFVLGNAFGWKLADCIFFGAMISVASTTIVAKVLSDFGKTQEPFAQIIFGILIIEDVVAIVMLALLSGYASTGSLNPAGVLLTVGHMAIFLAVILILGLIAVPRLFNYLSRTRSDEMLLVMALGLCLGIAMLAHSLGFSTALGAFLIGAVMAETRQIAKLELLTGPLRDMFSAIFFVAIGMLIDPAMLIEHWLVIVIVSVAVIVGKVGTCSFGAFVAGSDSSTSLRVGLGLAQIGEFSFIIAALGVNRGVTSDFLYPIAVAVSVVTTLLAPHRMRHADRIIGWFDRFAPRVLTRNMELYTAWVGQAPYNRRSMANRLLRQWAAQLGINFLLTAAVFGTAAYFAHNNLIPMPDALRIEFVRGGLYWIAALLLSLPLYVASFRKLQAMGLLLAEISVTREKAGGKTQALRGIIANFFLAVSAVVIIVATVLLSATILPPSNLAGAMTLLITILALLLRRHYVAVYARAQTALIDIFKKPPAPRLHEILPPSEILEDVELVIIDVLPESPLANKRLRELPLRAETTAAIVGIERDGKRSINPPADEQLLPGDRVLLLGARNQLDPAKALFMPGT